MNNKLKQKIKELEEENKRLRGYLNFGVRLEYPEYNQMSPYYESSVAMNETINQMIIDGKANITTLNGTFYLRYFLANLYRKGYRKNNAIGDNNE